MKGFLKFFILSMVVLSVAGCSSTPTKRSFKEYWKDQVAGNKIRYKLTRNHDVKFRNMRVSMWKGEATLVGRAVSDYEKERAEQTALSVKNVNGVKNYLEIVGQFADSKSGQNNSKNTPAVGNKNNTATQTVASKKAVIKEEPLKETPAKTANEALTAKTDLPIVGNTSKKKPVITVPSVDPSAKQVKAVAVKTPVEKKAVEPKPTVVKQSVVAAKPEAKQPAKVVNTATTTKPAQIMSQQEAASWYKKINETPVATVPTNSSKEMATKKDMVPATTGTTTLPVVTAPTNGPENDLAKEAAEELRRLRTPANNTIGN